MKTHNNTSEYVHALALINKIVEHIDSHYADCMAGLLQPEADKLKDFLYHQAVAILEWERQFTNYWRTK
ncbi:unnamed protein product [marine sediment metagenome]|uniref:Ferritin/DPS protein domain-containing protein n=1 Tax=marine sediment metagenome TaxID=412755 RepID=X1T6J6_9ZZZZ